jgi:hypothetical protein
MFSDSLSKSAHISNESLECNSGGEVAGPESMWLISIWEEIISFDRIGSLLLLDCSDVVSRSREENFHSKLWSTIDVPN